jgi:hypothetical protein
VQQERISNLPQNEQKNGNLSVSSSLVPSKIHASTSSAALLAQQVTINT